MVEQQKLTTEERRKKRIAQLKAKLQKEQALLKNSARKERNGQLVAFGVFVEEFFKDADADGQVRLEKQIKKYLSGRNLERALVGLSRLALK